MALVYDNFRIEFYLKNGKTSGFSELMVYSNQVPIEIYALAVGMTEAEAKAGLKDENFKVYYTTKTQMNAYNAKTHTYIYVYLKDSVITKLWVG